MTTQGQTKVSSLTTGNPQGTDESLAVDILDTTQSSTGTTKKYIRSDEFNYYARALGIVTVSPCSVAASSPLVAIYNNGSGGNGATLTNNGTLTGLIIDGITLAVGQRVLIPAQSPSLQNGIYVVTNTGSSISNWVLTRAGDYNTSPQIIQNQIILIQQGLSYAGQSFQETAPGPFIIGISAITYALYDITTSAIITQPPFISVTNPLFNMVAGNGYMANYSGLLCSLALPVVAPLGTVLYVTGGTSTGWTILQNAAQSIRIGNITSTAGVSGGWSSSLPGDSISLVCYVANFEWTNINGVEGILNYT